MVGIVIVGHCHLADELHRIVVSIVGAVEGFVPVSFGPDEPPEEPMRKLTSAVRASDTGDGVLILTDMFGGTPSNMSLSLLETGRVEVLTGLNIPMLVRLITIRAGDKSLEELARELRDYGRNNICLASEILYRQAE